MPPALRIILTVVYTGRISSLLTSGMMGIPRRLCDSVDRICLAEDRNQCRFFVELAFKDHVP
jgi:hypothetical protein